MKKLLIILWLGICGIAADAQSLYDQCVNEVESILNEAETIWYSNGTTYWYTPERQARYVGYCVKASSVVDNYLQRATTTADKVDLLWMQLRLLSNFLYNENGQSYNGISSAEYNRHVEKYMSIINKLSVYCNGISNADDRNLEQAYIAQNLGYIYYYLKNYQKAKEQFNVVVSKYNSLLNSTIDSDDVAELGQCGYYELGHIAYKTGNNTVATNYYNKAKSILDDDYIVPYEEL